MKQKIGEIQKNIGVIEFFSNDDKYENGLSFCIGKKMGGISRIDMDGNARIGSGSGIKIGSKNVDGFSITPEIREEINNILRAQKQEQERKETERKENIRKNEKLIFFVNQWKTFSCDESQDVFALVPKKEHEEVFSKEINDIYSAGAELSKTFWRMNPDTKGYVEINRKRFFEGDKIEYIELKKLLAPQYEQKIQEKKQKQEREQKIIEISEEKKQKAIQKARDTGKNVIIRVLGSFDGDGDRNAEAEFGKECGIINTYELATPTGKIEKIGRAHV